ncbi:hypothetical protein RvY_05604 [Ramazzottius varieornatus]|uniref:Serine aminopeptidase S33 domain-containing protein n=1 Tax=Ramazzottius varieornatus TaxID=947166 RepID=A0A1D1V5E3_RAMVA|nr:hypothetical protein RvY_05604 [Ramazzottius varieornatus]
MVMDFVDGRIFSGSQGVDIFCHYWKPQQQSGEKPRGLVFMAHGLFEYCGTDKTLIDALIGAGYFVFGHDHSGHGKSGGIKGQVISIDHYVTDVLAHVEVVKQKFPGLPVFIVGHSMGGTITLLAALEQPQLFRGVVLVAPFIIENPEAASPLKKFLARHLSKIAPNLGMVNLNNDHLTFNREVVERFNTDPLIFRDKVTIGTGYALLQAIEKLGPRIKDIRFPFLCIHGDADKMADVRGARLLENTPSTDKTISIYPNAYHRVQDEPNGVGEKCVAEVLSWISARS